MALWIHGGQIEAVDRDGVTLMVRVMSAREMVDFLKLAQTDPTSNGGLETYHALVKEGLQGWSGPKAPAFDDAAIEALSFGALQTIVKTVIEVNSLSADERGNSHAS